MKRKSLAVLLVSIMLTSALTACGTKEEGETHEPEVKDSLAIEAKPTEEPSEEPVEESVEEPVGEPVEEPVEDEGEQEENMDTTLSTILKQEESELWDKKNSAVLLDKVYEFNGSDKNTMISPLSLNMALGLLTEGAEGESKDALDSYLGKDYSTFADNYMHKVVPTYNVEVPGSDWDSGYKTAFEIANSVWIKDELDFSGTYMDAVQSKYDAEAGKFDITKPEESAGIINSWCEEKTHGMIPSIISSEQINQELASVLINSVYFEAGWENPWDYNEGYTDSTFTDIDGKEHNITFLRDSENLSWYYENDKATAFSKRYINGMQFIGILPKAEGEFTLESLDIPGLLQTRNNDYDVLEAMMPKLDFETTASLKDILKESYLNTIFSKMEANMDFVNMTEQLTPLSVSDIIQKTKLELDENGTKAAAVTAVVMKVDSMALIEVGEPVVKQVYLDRPFAFLIYDEKNDQIVFMGKVVNLPE